MSSRPAESRTTDAGMVMRATAIVRTKSIGVELRASGERRALDLHQHVDRHAFRMRRQARQRRDHADAVRLRLAHAEDAAAADVDAGFAHGAERVEPVLVGAGGDDRAVVFGRGVEVVVVSIEAGVFQPGAPGRVACRASRRSPCPAPDAFHHGADLLEVAVLGRAPGRAHAETARARRLGGARVRQHDLEAHQLLAP